MQTVTAAVAEAKRMPVSKAADAPKPYRQTIIKAADMLKALGHSGFDRFLLEMDLPEKSAGTGSGLMARATSLANYALSEPEVKTAEGQPIQEAILARAVQLWRQGIPSNLAIGEREAFEAALKREGLIPAISPGTAEEGVTIGGEDEGDGWRSTSITLSDESLQKLQSAVTRSTPKVTMPRSRKIFIVHGHEEAARLAVARFLEKLDFEVVILHEQANKGRTIIEKFEANGDVGFVVVLLTPDDEGSSVGKPHQHRARQNVILEWGYFIGRLGRGYVCALKKGDIELPSDVLGIVWEIFDEHGAWKQKLAKELSEAGFSVDWARVS